MVDAPAVTFGRVLGNRSFLRLWIAHLVSQLGDWLALLALFGIRRLYCGVAATMFAVSLAGYGWVRGWGPAEARPAATAP